MAENISYWSDRWRENRTGWHSGKVSQFLPQIYENLKGSREASETRIFVPLCGKTVDLKWLYDLGHSVVGVEAVDQAVEEFFSENSISHVKTSCDLVEGGATKYESKDGRLIIFVCDFFKFNVKCAGLMDAVWDRASLVAVEPKMRDAYMQTVIPLLGEGCRYVVETVEYDQAERLGHPHTILKDEVQRLFTGFQIEELGRISVGPDNKPSWAQTLTSAGYACYLIKM